MWKSLTRGLVKTVMKTGKVLIVHEACKTGGYGGELAAVIAESQAFDYLDAPIVRLAGKDIPIPYNRTLEANAVPQVPDIVAEARKLAKGKKARQFLSLRLIR
jgi:acetoin:2,6-dichlorophenolindophenol oxidoreductase subunit beta